MPSFCSYQLLFVLFMLFCFVMFPLFWAIISGSVAHCLFVMVFALAFDQHRFRNATVAIHQVPFFCLIPFFSDWLSLALPLSLSLSISASLSLSVCLFSLRLCLSHCLSPLAHKKARQGRAAICGMGVNKGSYLNLTSPG